MTTQVLDIEEQREPEDQAFLAGTLTDPKAIRRAKARGATVIRQMEQIQAAEKEEAEEVAREKAAKIARMNEAKAEKAAEKKKEQHGAVVDILATIRRLLMEEKIDASDTFEILTHLVIEYGKKKRIAVGFVKGLEFAADHKALDSSFGLGNEDESELA